MPAHSGVIERTFNKLYDMLRGHVEVDWYMYSHTLTICWSSIC